MEPVVTTEPDIPPPLNELWRQLLADLSAYFDAEKEVYGVQARVTRRAAGWSALFALGAIIIGQGAMIALVVGVLMLLGPLVGFGWATLIILTVCAILAGICILLIRSQLRGVKLAWRRRHDG